MLADRLAGTAAVVDLRGNTMRLAEAEFAFRMAASLPPRGVAYTVCEVMAATASLHPAIELPDSRYEEVTAVGAPQLIADAACAWRVAIGEPATVDWRAHDLDAHRVAVFKGDRLVAEGRGENVGGPLQALTWVANELAEYGGGLRAGDFIITGTCVVPVPIAPGEHLRVDFGDLGTIETTFRRE